jgi:hypothetical protein
MLLPTEKSHPVLAKTGHPLHEAALKKALMQHY